MTKYALLLSTGFLLLAASCQKTELTTLSPAAQSSHVSADPMTNAALAKGTVSSAHWTGLYDREYDIYGMSLPGGDPDNPIRDTTFVHNGVASLPYDNDYEVSSFFSNIRFFIPSGYYLPGDSLILETSVQNMKSSSLSDYDAEVEIVGTLHNIDVHFVADSAFVSQTGYTLGTIAKTGLPSLVTYFGTFKTIKLSTKKGQTGVYVNGKLLYHFTYDAGNAIGTVQEIRISGKGIFAADYVKLLNSVTNKKLMDEEFNTEGASHTIFY